MPTRKGREADLNRPLQMLAETLRSLQQEAGQVLDAVRIEPEKPGSDQGDLATTLEAQISRRAAALLGRWDMPTRSELEEIVGRIEQLERAVSELQSVNPVRKAAKKPAATAKTRRTAAATKRRKT